MDTASIIGQGSYTATLHKQKATQAAAMQAASGGSTDMNKVRDAAKKFESFFVGQMLEHMSSGIETDPTFGGGHGEEMWKSMLNQEYGKEISKTGRLGIADHVVQGMLRMQEQHNAAKKAALQDGTAQTTPVAPTAGGEQDLAQQDAAIALVAGTRTPPRR
jgi:flagellar protein FlgJ